MKAIASAARYLVHDGWSKKAQYAPDEVLQYGGACWTDWCNIPQDKRGHLKDMRQFIRENNFTEPADFHDYCDEHNETWAYLMDTTCQNAMYRYIDRNRYRLEKQRSMGRNSASTPPPQGESEPRTPNPDKESD